jgi:hypothetical protein
LTSVVVDDLTVDGQTISTTGSNKNVILDPHGSGTVDVNNSRITSVTDPSSASDAATKAYVDAQTQGLDVKDSATLGTTAALSGATYNNGAGTLTCNSNEDINNSSGLGQSVTLVQGDRILVKNQADTKQNGIYQVTTVGSGSAAWVLTRTGDANTAAKLTGGTFCFVEKGTNAENGYVFTHDGTPTLGTTLLTVSQFSGAGQITDGDGLTKSGNTLSVVTSGASTGIASDQVIVRSTGTNGQVLRSVGTDGNEATWGQLDLANSAAVTGTLPYSLGGTGLTAFGKGSVMVANTANTLTALDGGGSADGILFYTATSDTIAWATSLDGGTF